MLKSNFTSVKIDNRDAEIMRNFFTIFFKKGNEGFKDAEKKIFVKESLSIHFYQLHFVGLFLHADNDEN